MTGNDVLSRMMSAKLPPCECPGKSAEPSDHDPACLFRIVQDGIAEIERLRLDNRRLHDRIAPKDLPADKNRWVRLMCYFGGDGVWNSDDETADVGALPFSEALKRDVVDWQTKHGHGDVEEFSARGLSLAHRIKAELPDWKVIYIDRSKSRADIRNKDYFEYEISL